MHDVYRPSTYDVYLDDWHHLLVLFPLATSQDFCLILSVLT